MRAPTPPTTGGLGRRAVVAHVLLASAASTPWAALAAGGPSSLSGKPRPETGVVLLEPPAQTGRTLSGEMVVEGGVVAKVVFESAYALARGNYYDMEARNADGDAAFVHVATLPAGETLETVPSSFFTGTALGTTGRFGSYSAPLIDRAASGLTLGSVPAKLPCGATRFVDVSFSALTQAGVEVPRRGTIAAVQPRGSRDLVMLVSTVGAARWKKGGADDVRLAAESLRVTEVRPTALKRDNVNDYRYSGRSLKGFSEGESEIDAALARDLATQSGALTGKFGAAAAAGPARVAGYAPNF
jgi:hypothetical protein